MRIVKTRQAIFRALILLMSEKDISTVTITKLCKTAMINRKTFYVHYSSIADVLDDFENQIVFGFIDAIIDRKAVTSSGFDTYKYIMLMNDLVEENRKDFDIVFPFLKSGRFLRKLGAEIGKLSFRFIQERPGYFDPQAYPFSFVFTLCGLVTSYFDWIDFGMQFPITELAEISKKAIDTPLSTILTPHADNEHR